MIVATTVGGALLAVVDVRALIVSCAVLSLVVIAAVGCVTCGPRLTRHSRRRLSRHRGGGDDDSRRAQRPPDSLRPTGPPRPPV